MAFVITTVAPIFGLIALGLAAARFKWLSPTAGQGVAEFTFQIAMPALLFRTIVVADLGPIQPAVLLTGYFSTVALIWAAATLIAALFLARPAPESAVFAMTASYSNIVLLGIPIALSAYGERAAPVAAVIVSMHVAGLWLAACLHLAVVEPKQSLAPLELIRSVAIEFAKNPIVVAIVIGALWRVTGLGLHASIDRGLHLITQAGVPCALFAVGFSLAGFRIGGEIRTLLASFALKNVALPLLTWIMTAHVFGIAPFAATVITLLTAMPTGTATYLFASRNGVAVQTTSATVAFSTAASMLTLPAALYLLGRP